MLPSYDKEAMSASGSVHKVLQNAPTDEEIEEHWLREMKAAPELANLPEGDETEEE